MTGESDPVPLATKTSDLPVRAASALVMIVLAAGALWVGGIVLKAFVALVAVVAFGEYVRLILRATANTTNRSIGVVFGAVYISLAAWFLISREVDGIILLLGSVIFVDTFAYFAGRTFGGPKIAPKISPSKTWAGLIGGALGATIFHVVLFQALPAYQCWRSTGSYGDEYFGFDGPCSYVDYPFDLSTVAQLVLIGILIAVVAQAGDFFESWLKRRAGVKDSSQLIPGHGGVFDRVDGLIALAFMVALFQLVAT